MAEGQTSLGGPVDPRDEAHTRDPSATGDTGSSNLPRWTEPVGRWTQRLLFGASDALMVLDLYFELLDDEGDDIGASMRLRTRMEITGATLAFALIGLGLWLLGALSASASTSGPRSILIPLALASIIPAARTCSLVALAGVAFVAAGAPLSQLALSAAIIIQVFWARLHIDAVLLRTGRRHSFARVLLCGDRILAERIDVH